MKRFAVLDYEGKVVNIIVAGSQSIAEQVTFSECVHIAANVEVNLGDKWNGTTFTKPELEA